MATRFGRLRQSQKLSEAYTKYKEWQDRPYAPQPGSRGQAKSRLPVYLHPFGITFDDNEVYTSRADPNTIDELSGYLAGTGGSVSQTLASTEKLIKVSGFKAARIIIFKNASYSASPKKSDITQQDYLKYEGVRQSLPFGQDSGTDEMITVFNQARANIFTALASSNEILRVSLQREEMAL